ncbi:hypothetical protein FACS189415_5720 [Bacteroidia bacterium]|nr:hypothetical protein FACS189415_5720 [Bacteroidia bacterium]
MPFRGKQSRLEISFNESGEIQTKMESNLDFTTEDMAKFPDIFKNILLDNKIAMNTTYSFYWRYADSGK